MRHLAILARSPVPGEVKTRLSPALPHALAAQLYQAMLADTIAAAVAADADDRTLFWAPTAAGSGFPVPGGFRERDQVGTTLGDRLASAFGELLSDPTDRAVVIGADCPDMDSKRIDDAFAGLDHHDLVLGPAGDGGYYLIGLRRSAPTLFEGVTWGTERVLEETLERAERARLAVSMLGRLSDLDTPADLVSFVARRCLEPTGQRTEAALREMGLLPPA